MAGKTKRHDTRRMLSHSALDGKPLVGPVGSTAHFSFWVDVPIVDFDPDEVPLYLRSSTHYVEFGPGGVLGRTGRALASLLRWPRR